MSPGQQPNTTSWALLGTPEGALLHCPTRTSPQVAPSSLAKSLDWPASDMCVWGGGGQGDTNPPSPAESNAKTPQSDGNNTCGCSARGRICKVGHGSESCGNSTLQKLPPNRFSNER